MQTSHSFNIMILLVVSNLLVLGFVVFVYFSRMLQAKQRQQFQQLLLQQEIRSRESAFQQISRDLHDDFGATLSGIKLLTQYVLEQFDKSSREASQEMLQRISGYTNDMIERVNDLAWLMNPEVEPIGFLVEKIRKYGAATTAAKQILFDFHSSLEHKMLRLSLAERKALYLVSKEALNNAVKYSNCSIIRYSLQYEQKELKLSISDDGLGFDQDSIAPGQGLRNMNARAGEINATFNLESAPGKGTRIEMTITRDPEGNSTHE